MLLARAAPAHAVATAADARASVLWWHVLNAHGAGYIFDLPAFHRQSENSISEKSRL